MNIQTVGVVGAGLMGNGIAQVCAAAGLDVTLVDIQDAALAKALQTIDANLERLVRKDKLSAADKAATLARIRTSTRYEDLSGVQLAIEAATENLDIKLRILRQLDSLLGADALIASNTSSISITQLAAVTTRPERFIGMHFFNPVPVMALVELIRGLQTADSTQERALAFVQSIGKTPVSVKNAPGFAVNRILCPMLNEAIYALQEGVASAEDIDAGMRLGCNHPIGPLALADLVGLDTLLSIMEVGAVRRSEVPPRPAAARDGGGRAPRPQSGSGLLPLLKAPVAPAAANGKRPGANS